ncbi:hypothetical protein [Streptomyces olivoreticuli]|uniref:hypothetical protein n=1 Tax=Streptomyces olivoreticuli TaxID=68246 RepID=UPI0030B84FEE
MLFTFALGTAAGDLTGEQLNPGYPVSAPLFGAVIAAAAVAHFKFRLDTVVAFWITYVAPRPLGASLDDLSVPVPLRRRAGQGCGRRDHPRHDPQPSRTRSTP